MRIRNLFASPSRSTAFRHFHLEQLEDRTTPTAAINLTAASYSVPVNLSQYVPLSLVTQPSLGTAVQYIASSSNPQVSTQVLTSTEAWDLTVTGTDGNGSTFKGDLIIQLFPNESPAAVQQIVTLTNQGFYNGLDFFRVLNGFAAQAGDPNNVGTGGSSLPNFQDQFAADLSFNSPGMVAFANSGPDTNNSQFFLSALTDQNTLTLNFKYDIFGQLVSGFSTFNSLMSTSVTTNPVTGEQNSYPINRVTITNAQIIDDPAVAVLKISAPAGFLGTGTVNVTADDGSGPSAASFGVTYANTYLGPNGQSTPVPNNPAFLGTIANQTTYANTPISFQIPATDVENDQLTYVVTDPNNFGVSTPPPNVTVSINQATGVATVTPNAGFTGTVNMLIGVRDQTLRPESNNGNPSLNDQAQFDTHEVTLTVLANNNNSTQAPVINPITLPPVADGTLLSFTAYATAPTLNGAAVPLTYSLGMGFPLGARVNAQTGQVTWTPSNSNDQPPGTYTLIINAAQTSNPSLATSQTFTITVGPTSTIQGTGLASRTTVAQGIVQSTEYYNNLVTAAFQKYLGRTPLPSELPYWTNQLLAGTLSDEQLEAGFISSQEFINDHGGSPPGQTWIQSLYQVFLGRTAEQSEVNYWLTQMANGETPYQVAVGFATSQERESNRVAADYQQYLGRSAAPAEIAYWVNVFDNGGSNEKVVAGFLASQEYFQEHGNNIVDWLYADYRAALTREPDSSGLSYWESRLE